MASFKSDFSSVSAGEREFKAQDGVIEIPDEFVDSFKDFIASGQLVLIEKPVKVKREKEEKK